MFETREEKCHAIIHSAAIATGAVGAGLAQMPLADTVPITAIQVGMIVSIGEVFDAKMSEGVAKGILTGLITGNIGKQAVGLALGWIPGFGNAIKATTAATLTETIGWGAVKHFESLEKENEENEKTAFECGKKAGEKETKVKVEKNLKEGIERDYFLITRARMVCYIKNSKDREAIMELEKILEKLNPKTANRFKNEIHKIYISNNKKDIEDCIEKLDEDCKLKLINFLENIEDFEKLNKNCELKYIENIEDTKKRSLKYFKIMECIEMLKKNKEI